MGLFDGWSTKVKTFVKNAVVFPGNIVEGYIQVEAVTDIDFVAVRIKATGKERTMVREERRGASASSGAMHKRTHRRSNVFYKQLVTVAGDMKCSGQRTTKRMPAGTYTYPFAFQLPTGLPASMLKKTLDDKAEICYYVKAYVDIPRGMDAKHHTFLTVLCPMPNNQWVHRAPVSVDRSWDVTCCCCISKGKVSGRLFMDRTMIAMDRDNLTVCAELDNTQGKEEIQGVEITLLNHLNFHAGTLHREHKRIYAGRAVIKDVVPPGQKGVIRGTIPLPRDSIPTMETHLIRSWHVIELELNIPNASDPSHQFPVIVGQSVDLNDFSPPIQWSGVSNLMVLGQGQAPEFYYQPPPTPAYQLSPIPGITPPAGAPMMQVQFQSAPMPLPASNVGWMPPTDYENQTTGASVQWQPGYTQQHQAVENVAVYQEPEAIQTMPQGNGPAPVADPMAQNQMALNAMMSGGMKGLMMGGPSGFAKGATKQAARSGVPAHVQSNSHANSQANLDAHLL